MKSIISMIVILSVIAIIGSGQSVFATGNGKNYNNGYRDGLSDCHSDPSTWAMNLASNAGHHSAEFLAGHDAGLAACNSQSTTTVSTDNQNSNNVDQNNRNQPQAQTAANANHCFVLIGTCGAPGINQGQSLNN